MSSIFGRVAVPLFSLLVHNAATCLAQQPDTAQLLDTAAKASGELRYAAIDDLGETHRDAPRVVPQLRKLLADQDPQARWRAARALGDYGTLAQAAAPALATQLGDKDPILQYHSAVALGKIGERSDAVIDSLVKAVTSPDGRVARAAIAALRALKPDPQRVAAALEQVLTSNDQSVQLYAIEALVERGAEAAPMLNEALKRPQTAYLACTAIEQIGPDAAPTVPAIIEVLGKTRHSHLQIQALLALASIGSAAESAAPQIVPLLHSPNDATVPVAAAYALGSIGANDDRTLAALQRAMTNDDEFLQMIAVWSLAKLKPRDQDAMQLAVTRLTQGLKSENADLRTAAAKELQMLQAPPEMVAPELVALINDPDPDVQANVIHAVASLGESIVPRLVNALQNPERQGPAVRVLTQLGPKAAGAVQPLVNAAKGATPELHTEINFALAAIGSAASPAAGMLAATVTSDSQDVRESALYALREIGPGAKVATSALLKRMQADDSFEAMAAAWALARVAPNDAAIAGRAVPKLARGLSSSDETIRLASAQALTAWGQAANPAVAILKRVAEEDSSAEVRAAAEAGLARIAPGQ